jgi:tyrosine-protein phosphatase YwqE
MGHRNDIKYTILEYRVTQLIKHLKQYLISLQIESIYPINIDFILVRYTTITFHIPVLLSFLFILNCIKLFLCKSITTIEYTNYSKVTQNTKNIRDLNSDSSSNQQLLFQGFKPVIVLELLQVLVILIQIVIELLHHSI